MIVENAKPTPRYSGWNERSNSVTVPSVPVVAVHGVRHAQAVGGVSVDQRNGDALGLHHPPCCIISICESAVAHQVAPVVPSVGDKGDADRSGRM